MSFIFVYLLISIQLKTAQSYGYVFFSNQYQPLNTCIFDKDEGFYFYWTCYNQQLYLQLYSSETCDGISSLNESTASDYPFDCDSTQNYNDYIQYTIYNLDLNGNIQCNVINNNKPNSYAQIINKCVYDPQYQVFKMDTCTDTIWNTLRYSDSNCMNLIHFSRTIDDCKHNETYIDITRCTTKLNAIGDEFGYIQFTKTSVLQPLDECIISTESFSYLFICINNDPYYYYWFTNSCDSISNNDGSGKITPFSYSCSSNKNNFAKLQIYSNNNNCTKPTSQMNHTSNVFITNQCYNSFDNNNNMISTIWRCQNSSLWSVQYNAPNCNGTENGSFITSLYTEDCSNGDIEQYLVECVSISTTTTIPPQTTLLPTKEPTIFVTPTPTQKNERILYVTKTGQDNADCYSNGICGTLRYTSMVANNLYKWENLSRIEIVIQGQNPTEIKESVTTLDANPCIPHQLNPFIFNFDEITYTFDPNYIHSMEDWYYPELCENYSRELDDNFFSSMNVGLYTIIVNNMMFDGYRFNGNAQQPFYIAFTDTFICNNCIFSNIIIDSEHHINVKRSALILAANAHFNHCIFKNITYNNYNPSSPTTDIYGYDYSIIIIDKTLQSIPETHSFSFEMTSNSEISSITGLSYFVYFNLDSNEGDFYAIIQDTTFTEIAVIDTIINNNPDLVTSTSSTIDIMDTNFFDLTSGSILHSMEGKCEITISNMNVTTTQTVEKYLERKELIGREKDDYYSLFVFDEKDQIINMDHVNVKYLYSYYITTHCSDQFGSTYNTLLGWLQIQSVLKTEFDFWLFMYQCNNPIQFIDNIATLNINHLSVSNDIDDRTMQQYRDYIEQEIKYLLPSALNDDIYIDFFYKIEEDYAFIYNDGALTIDTLNIYGAGICETIILNPDGTLIINDMNAIPETYCITSNNACNYDADALQINYWIRFNAADSICDGGELRVSNSFLYGTKIQTLLIGGGYVYLHNITIQYAMSGIIASPKVKYLELLSSDMIDIGTFYSSSQRNLYSYKPLYIPFVLKASEILIKDCIFSYVSPYQFELFDSTGYYNNLYVDVALEQQLISLINNVFEINDENILKPFPSHQTLHYLDDFSIWSSFLDDTKNDTISDLVAQHFILNGCMVIPNNIKMTMINNEFRVNENNVFVNESVLINYNIPWIYVQNGNDTESTICISGNEFINFAIWIQKGNITSCVKTNMIQYIDNNKENCDSYGTFGSINNIALDDNNGQSNIFNIDYDELDTIIKGEDNTNIALDNNIINIAITDHDINDTVNILNMQSGNYLFVDTIVTVSDDFDFDIQLHEECKINCYSVMQNDSNLIPILNVECSENMESENTTSSIDSLYDIQLTTHFSPYYVKISTLNDSTYFPSDKLLLKYLIFDIYNNQIQSIGQDIMINFQSMDNIHSFQIVIGGNGECVECETGIFFPSMSLNKIGDTLLFKGNIYDNSLFVDGLLNITIIECPAGYGSTKARQCELCGKGYFNLLPTNNSCYYCNENGNIDGIICIGGNNIIIDYNYWIMVYQYNNNNNNNNIDLFDMNEYIISTRCPEKYCCQLQDGCDFVYDIDKLCAKNRDYNEYLCGKCIASYSEVFGTTHCAKCEHNHFERLLIPLSYGFLWAIFIIWTKSRKIKNNDKDIENNKDSKRKNRCYYCCNGNKDDKDNKNKEKMKLSVLSYEEYLCSLERMLSKVIVYFYQSVGYILTTNGVELSLYSFVELFNLNIFTAISWSTSNSNNDDNNNGYCLLKNMTMPQKLAIQLTVSGSILFFILLFYLLNKYASINIYKCINNKINYSQSLLSALLLCVGQVLSITFRLLACRNIGNYKTVHYFFGSQECYGVIWISSFVSLLFVILSFFILFVFIYFHNDTKNINNDEKKLYFYYSVIGSYKDKHWYWELILFIKRLLFAFIFIVFDDNNLKIFMGILLTIYLFIHLHYEPFKWNYVNKLDSYLTASIIIIIFMDGAVVNMNETFYIIIISILIIFPISWYLWFMISNCKSLKNKQKKNHYHINSPSANSPSSNNDEIGIEKHDEIELQPPNTMTLHIQQQKQQYKQHHIINEVSSDYCTD